MLTVFDVTIVDDFAFDNNSLFGNALEHMLLVRLVVMWRTPLEHHAEAIAALRTAVELGNSLATLAWRVEIVHALLAVLIFFACDSRVLSHRLLLVGSDSDNGGHEDLLIRVPGNLRILHLPESYLVIVD